MDIKTLGIDIGKTVFHLIGLDAHGKIVLRRRVSRTQLIRFAANLPVCLIGMEACGGAHHLSRALLALGHDVRLMPPQYVRPFVKSHKNDYRDAEAIAEAVQRPTMRFVATKTPEQLDLQALHRVRERLVGRRTALINQIRAFLLERGLTVGQGVSRLRQRMPSILEPESEADLSALMQRLLSGLWQEWQSLDHEIAELTGELERLARSDEICRRLRSIPGIGPITATALVAAVGNASGFSRGRDLAAWLGLVPRQFSTGGKTKLLGISKRGNRAIRRLLVQGAHAVLQSAERQQGRLGVWIRNLLARRHHNLAAVALANKMARIAWAVITRKESYSPAII
ncbi:IS110 family transposase [Denitrobaculum tricleocarpae]|uniref:IS110 family transposase n=1 Tax=Denitrobaculum tricleocarpae TaxID=2591009 RepID=A0A545SRX1_9PROT|nr:IS110 family transposase [Denitrobaculum tricleocarpae]TQV67723.1 IS110 family transposase [Denitrobaculum tricleocarpae]